MALISPFRAWRYDPHRVPLQDVVTQPYDKITPAMQDRYYNSSPYNLVRIILGKPSSSDSDRENVYTRAAADFKDWRTSGVLQQDAAPSIYFYSQTFAPPGHGSVPSVTPLERKGFIALGKLENYTDEIVFRHEQTLAKPKADRLDLLRSTRAHFGQIFMLYNGAGEIIALIESTVDTSRPPDIEVSDDVGVHNRVWKISEPAILKQVQAKMRSRSLIIADGHHRYETALTYRREQLATADTSSGALAPYDSAMMTFVDMDQPGLVVLPTHRVVFGLPSFSPEKFESAARKFFSLEEVDPHLEAPRAVEILRNAGRSGTALLAVTQQRAFLLHSLKATGTPSFGTVSLRQQSLDVVQLHKCLIEQALNISEESIRNQESVSFCREAAEALAQVRSGKAQLAFVMNPVRMQQVCDIAFAGEVMPQKSTDFYPKLLSGLTIYALD